MKKLSLGIILMSLTAQAAPPSYYTALTDAPPFVTLLAANGADLVSIINTDIGDCPGCYGFEVGVVFPDGSDDTLYFVTELTPTGQVVVTLVPEGPPAEPYDDDFTITKK